MQAPPPPPRPTAASPPAPAAFQLYAQALRARLQQALDADPVLSQGEYQADLRIAVGADGRVLSARLLTPSGEAERDRRIEAVAGALAMEASPPRGFPPAVRLRVRSRSPDKVD